MIPNKEIGLDNFISGVEYKTPPPRPHDCSNDEIKPGNQSRLAEEYTSDRKQFGVVYGTPPTAAGPPLPIKKISTKPPERGNENRQGN